MISADFNFKHDSACRIPYKHHIQINLIISVKVSVAAIFSLAHVLLFVGVWVLQKTPFMS